MASKVAIVKCESYDQAIVDQAVSEAIELIGGINQFVQPEENILLKPNMLSAKEPERAVTTHPSILNAMIKLLKEADYQQVAYGDSPGFGSPEKTAKSTGLKLVADKWQVPLADFVSGSTVPYLEGQICKQFEIAKGVQEADAIISLSKMKSHQLTRITGAVKNQLGCVNGLNKAGFHAKYPDGIGFSEMLIDLNQLLKPRLYLMDGVVAMEGNGPASGNPRKMNVILASSDPIALDATFCRMIDLDPEFVPTNVFGEKHGLGSYKEEAIEIVGEPLTSLICKDFDVVRMPVKDENFNRAAKFRNLMLRKPVINKDKCVKCGICVDACPVEGKACLLYTYPSPRDLSTSRMPASA
jgi:uncharacterized protein (DUF362 family)